MGAQFTKGNFSPTYGSAYIWTRGGLSKYKKDVTSSSVCIEPYNGGLGYGVSVKVLRTGIKRLNRHLKWTEEDGYRFSYYLVTPKTKRETCVRRIHSDLKALKRALKKIYGNLIPVIAQLRVLRSGFRQKAAILKIPSQFAALCRDAATSAPLPHRHSEWGW